MQVALHFGAPYTDENRLQLCLGSNREALAEIGTIIPRPSSYRKTMRPVLTRFKDGTGDDALRAEYLREVIGDQQADRVVLSNDTFLGIPRASVGNDQFFPGPFNRIDALQRLFDGAEIELFYGLCNPATFIQGLLVNHPGEDIETLIGHSDPMQLRWSEFLGRIHAEFPHLQITAWCNEDTPLIWDEVIREIAGVDPMFQLEGTHDFLKELMSAEGFERFTEFLAQRPGMSEIQKRRVIAAFLEKFAAEEMLEEEVDYPGWTDMHVDTLTELYDEDVFAIQSLPYVKFISP
ncbi:hypothetical protein N6L24_00825 [Cognatishimia sp. SS12]|uniref:hypothetical protein n=1 Tax=Cognatishimia sp. SS12 TaxID=2979465 RepID=UPI00232AA68B|nr:hypothetical protein [Cognatishimia sp. SS12]MDC0736810.1 hypothetical protein [Cognatishimia sp. SS12]